MTTEPKKISRWPVVWLGLFFLCLCLIPVWAQTQNANLALTPRATVTSVLPEDTATDQLTSLPTIIDTPLAPSETPEPLLALRSLVENKLGKSLRDVPRVENFTFDAGTGELSITIAASESLFSHLSESVEIEIYDTLQTISQSNTAIPYKSISITVTFPLVDVYGNSHEGNVVLATYTRETLSKINWSNFLFKNIYQIAEQKTLYIHNDVKP